MKPTHRTKTKTTLPDQIPKSAEAVPLLLAVATLVPARRLLNGAVDRMEQGHFAMLVVFVSLYYAYYFS